MSPKEKAKELVDRMFGLQVDAQTFHMYNTLETAKYSALIAIEEMLKVTPKYSTDELLTPKGSTEVRIPNCTYEYLEQVKQEINAL